MKYSILDKQTKPVRLAALSLPGLQIAPEASSKERPSATPSKALPPDHVGDANSPYNHAAISKALQGGVLKNHVDDVIAAAKKEGVNPAFLAAVMAHESGGGTSSAARNKNNFTGICGAGKPKTFPDIESGIAESAAVLGRYVRRGENTISLIQPKYSPITGTTNDPKGSNKSWAGSVTKLLQQFSKPEAEKTMLASAKAKSASPRV